MFMNGVQITGTRIITEPQQMTLPGFKAENGKRAWFVVGLGSTMVTVVAFRHAMGSVPVVGKTILDFAFPGTKPWSFWY